MKCKESLCGFIFTCPDIRRLGEDERTGKADPTTIKQYRTLCSKLKDYCSLKVPNLIRYSSGMQGGEA